MMRRWFERVTRSVALLLVLALPIQGWATGVMRGCLAHHGGGPATTATHAPAPTTPAPGAHDMTAPAHDHGHGAHASHHHGTLADGNGVAAATDSSPAPVKGATAVHGAAAQAGHCAACASCAGVAAMPALIYQAVVEPAPSTPVLDRSVPRRARFETDGPERPPRPFLA